MEAIDFASILSISTLSAIALGTIVGLLIGTLPGMGATITIVILLPLTYAMSPLAAILLLVSAYQASEYGGSISSIIIGVPGTPAAVATVLDGNALAKKSYPGKALGYSLTASTIGGLIGAVVLTLLAVPLSRFAIRFSDPEFFLIGLLGIMAVAGLSSDDKIKSSISVILGLLIGTIGIDVFTGTARFTMGTLELMEGLAIIAVLIGMFGFSELFKMISTEIKQKYITNSKGLSTHLSFTEVKSVLWTSVKSSFIGSIVGIFPGMGAGPASWFAYSEAKRSSKEPDTFGKGNPNGIAAPEAANNATVGGALIPLLALGIPGSPATAIIMGAFIIHGLQPGPRMFDNNTGLMYGIFVGFFIATILMFIIGKFATALFARVLTVPNYVLIPTIFLLSIIGVYISHNMFFNLWIALLFGVVMFILKKLDFSLPSFILAFILSPIIEQSLRRSLLLSDGSYSIFFTRGYSLFLISLIIFFLIGMSVTFSKKRAEKNDRLNLS